MKLKKMEIFKNDNIDVTHDNAPYTVTSNFDVLNTKIRVSKATSLKCVLFSSKYMYQFVCLFLFVRVSLLLSIILVFRFLLIRSKGRINERTNEQTDERTDRQLFLILILIASPEGSITIIKV